MLSSITWAVVAWRRVAPPRSTALRLLGAQLWVALVVEVLGTALSLCGASNAWLYDLYIAVEFVLLLSMAHALQLLPYRTTWVLACAFLVLVGLEVLRSPDTDRFLVISASLSALALTGLYLRLLWQRAERVRGPLLQDQHFWTGLGHVIFFGAMTPVVAPMDLLIATDPFLASSLYYLLQLLCCVRYWAIARGLRHATGVGLVPSTT